MTTRETSLNAPGAKFPAHQAWSHPEWYWGSAIVLPILIAPFWNRLVARFDVPELQGMPGFILVCLVVACALTDVLYRRIPNWATYPATLWALALNAASSIQFWLVQGRDADVALELNPPSVTSDWIQGTVGMGSSVLGLLACFAVMLLPYKLSKSGAGDVKLAAAIGSLLGFRSGLLALAMTYLAAGFYVFLYIIWTAGPVPTLKALTRWCAAALLLHLVLPPTREQQALLNQSIPMGPFFATGTAMVLFHLLERLEVAALAGGLV
jgi:Flp pilus assembly protein protease CpaA